LGDAAVRAATAPTVADPARRRARHRARRRRADAADDDDADARRTTPPPKPTTSMPATAPVADPGRAPPGAVTAPR
jgi:hypothetical protein